MGAPSHPSDYRSSVLIYPILLWQEGNMAGEQSDFQGKLFVITSIYDHWNRFWHDESPFLKGSCANGITETLSFMASKWDHVILGAVWNVYYFLGSLIIHIKIIRENKKGQKYQVMGSPDLTLVQDTRNCNPQWLQNKGCKMSFTSHLKPGNPKTDKTSV